MTTRRGLLSTGTGRTVAAALGLVAGAALAGCQMASPLTTDLDYEPADGVSVYVDDVVVRDLIVVSEAAGSEGRVTGLAANRGSEPASVTVVLGDAALMPTLEIPAGGAVRLDGTALGQAEPGEAMTIASVPSEPGAYLDLRVSVAGGGSESAAVPVLTPDPPYDQMGSTADQDEVTGR